MAIYGLNFNGVAIPPEVRKRFPQRIRAYLLDGRNEATIQGPMADLVGVASSEFVGGKGLTVHDQISTMIAAGSNGHRGFTTAHRMLKGVMHIALYTYPLDEAKAILEKLDNA